MFDLSQTTYLVPCIREPNRSIGIDISEISKAESRLDEVAIVNIQTAPDLLTTFNRNWLDLNRITSLLVRERDGAANLVKRKKAEALLECNDEAIKARGHSKASADLRDALAELNPEVAAAKERLEEVTVLLLYLKGKQDAFQRGYESVKKLVGTGQLPPAHHGANNNKTPFSQPKQTTFTTETKVETEDEFQLPIGFK